MKTLLMSVLESVLGNQFADAQRAFRPGTPGRSKTLSARLKDAFREANPGVSLDMHRYARRYRNLGVNRAKRPFSAKR